MQAHARRKHKCMQDTIVMYLFRNTFEQVWVRGDPLDVQSSKGDWPYRGIHFGIWGRAWGTSNYVCVCTFESVCVLVMCPSWEQVCAFYVTMLEVHSCVCFVCAFLMRMCLCVSVDKFDVCVMCVSVSSCRSRRMLTWFTRCVLSWKFESVGNVEVLRWQLAWHFGQ